MIRKQFYITEAQDAKLKKLAAERDATEAELVRAAIEAYGQVQDQEGARNILRVSETALKEGYMTEKLTSVTVSADERRIFLDDAAWAEEMAFIRGLVESGERGRTAADWRFNREEIYEDRNDEILR
jgi:hypothetical protein